MTTVLIATDEPTVAAEMQAAVLGPDTTHVVVHAGSEVLAAVKEHDPDLVVLDLQIGNEGGIACCLELRHEEGAGRLEPRPILLLLDRPADTFLARTSRANGWLVKPIDGFRLRRAAQALLAGEEFTEGSTATADV